ncbi:male-specific sperm protein Mst84Db-like [Diaphorina citri]|uniref:Male-specific sperm protein Mst84Db-like n=1 Tax=Diaphorina citri TaxID=121845 RepID=A0A1S4EQ37_DIACI|nr:male-specific sperm protein Mst84Db-like [Diaphorina citri]KAI5713582.1 hypothetical protein M8J76_001657 [Diaphorina citri]KAI5714754.1 hypothetical protein M8J77_004991 [Diaphorina citri]
MSSMNKLCGGCGPCGSSCGCCNDCCRPRLSVGVVYPNAGAPQAAPVGMNQLCGSCAPCGGCCDCRPRLSIGVVYPNNLLEVAQCVDGPANTMFRGQ